MLFSSYREEDVVILLKDITGMVKPQDTVTREKLIQNGRHYSEMLPIEYEPTEKYMKAYGDALNRFSGITAAAVAKVCEKIYQQKRKDVALVSLARAGSSIGVLIKHYFQKYYGFNPTHYTISIIRGRGIDKNALKYILARHNPKTIQFVDGWTGKGAIQRELKRAMKDFPNVDASLAVLSDPAYLTETCGAHEDFLIPSSCLNSTVSGLLSRTFYRRDIIGETEFHGAAFYRELASKDLTYQFIDAIEQKFPFASEYDFNENTNPKYTGMEEVAKIAEDFNIDDINLIKPGIGEATRVLLRRMPERILVRSLNDDKRLGHLYELAAEKGTEICEYPLKNYLACGLIKSLTDT